jgi:hypothetical protein
MGLGDKFFSQVFSAGLKAAKIGDSLKDIPEAGKGSFCRVQFRHSCGHEVNELFFFIAAPQYP